MSHTPLPSHKLTDGILEELRKGFLSLSPSTLEHILCTLFTSRGKMYAKDKGVMCDVLGKGVIQVCVCMLIGGVREEFQQRFAASLGMEEVKKDNVKQMKDKVLAMGVGEYLETLRDRELLDHFGYILGIATFDHPADPRQQLADEILMRGTHRMLEFLSPPVLKDICDDLHIKGNLPSPTMIDRILQKIFHLIPSSDHEDIGVVMEAEEECVSAGKKRKRSLSSSALSKAPSTAAAVTTTDASESEEEGGGRGGERGESVLADGTIPGTEVWPLDRLVAGLNAKTIYTHYNMSDLRAFCKLHGLSPFGKKMAVIKRIIDFFDRSAGATDAKS